VSTEQNSRDRLFDPDSDTTDARDREDGPEPVDETEDTIRDPAAHRPTVANPDQRTSEEIAEEGTAAPDGAADDRRVEDNTGDDSADGDRGGQPVVRDSFGSPGDDEAAGFSDGPDDVTAASGLAAPDDAVDGADEQRSKDEGDRMKGDRGEDDLDRQAPGSTTDLAQADGMSGEAVDEDVNRADEDVDRADEDVDRADEDVDRTAADGGPADAAGRADLRAVPAAAAAVPDEQPSDEAPGGGHTPDVEDAGALLPDAETDRLRIRWREVQLGFVDDPRQAVDDAAELVSLAVDRVASLLRDQVGALNDDRPIEDADGSEPDTEGLRTLMQRYHALLDRMLGV
jgi:hypothetical protein